MKVYLFNIVIALFMLTAILSCKVAPKEIDYGHDHCRLCDMTVVDKTHSAEYVTKKGKAYMFDSVECLVRDINKNNHEDTMAFVLVADYGNPGELVDAAKATYLISVKIKSPMGANLSAFSSQEVAKTTQAEFGGELYNWEQLKTHFVK